METKALIVLGLACRQRLTIVLTLLFNTGRRTTCVHTCMRYMYTWFNLSTHLILICNWGKSCVCMYIVQQSDSISCGSRKTSHIIYIGLISKIKYKTVFDQRFYGICTHQKGPIYLNKLPDFFKKFLRFSFSKKKLLHKNGIYV